MLVVVIPYDLKIPRNLCLEWVGWLFSPRPTCDPSQSLYARTVLEASGCGALGYLATANF